MKLTDELPHFRAEKRDGCSWLLMLTDYDAFLKAWTDGAMFWSGLTASGTRVTIKLADIVSINEWDEAHIAFHEREHDERRMRKLTESDL